MKVNDPKVMHTDSIHIRPYRDSDRDQVIALWNEVLADGAPHNDPATSIRKKLEIERDLFLVADAASQVVGIAMGGYDGHRGWVYAVAVNPLHQRCGVGRALIRAVEEVLTQLGCLKVNLQVRSMNAEAIAFYRKLGYSVEDRVSLGQRLY